MGVPLHVPAAQSFVVTLTLRVRLRAGGYRIAVALHKGLTHQEGCYHWREDATALIIMPAGRPDDDASCTAGRDREETAVSIAYGPRTRSCVPTHLSD
jgi:hypothetical protein